jgi:hypothetical protein
MREIEDDLVGGSCVQSCLYSLYTCCHGGLSATARDLCRNNPAIDFEEVEAVARLAKVDLEDFCMLQCAYEVAARCTSVVAPLPDGTPVHARTMDWGALFLRKLSCEMVFTRGGMELFRASSWAGYLGVLTGGQAPSVYIYTTWACSQVAIISIYIYYLGVLTVISIYFVLYLWSGVPKFKLFS